MTIFRTRQKFSGVFNTLVNEWCVKKKKNVFNVFIHAFPEIPEMLGTHAFKKNQFSTLTQN